MTKARVEAIRDPGEAARLSSELDRFRDESAYLRRNRAAFTRRYAGQWIALRQRALVAHAPRLRDIDRELRRLGLCRRDVLLEFLTEDGQNLIL